jgi:Leucine-rich repeat (LRR) protein
LNYHRRPPLTSGPYLRLYLSSKYNPGRTPLPDHFDRIFNDIWRLDECRDDGGGDGGGGGGAVGQQEGADSAVLALCGDDGGKSSSALRSQKLRDVASKIVSNLAALWPVSYLTLVSTGDATSQVPHCLGHLPLLDKMVVQGRGFHSIPASFASASFTDLQIANTHISTIPESLGKPASSRLKALCITKSALASIPPTFVDAARRGGLLEANFAFNELHFHTVPAPFWGLRTLKVLSLERNRLSGPAPPGLGNLVSMVHLCLSGNHISSLPETIGQLQHLTTLQVDNNMLESLPVGLGECRQLQELSAHCNQLGPELPDLWHRLDPVGSIAKGGYRLRTLCLHSNKLRHLPSSVCALRDLETLICHSNMLQTLPSQMRNLSKCKELDVHKNALVEFPPEGLPPHLSILRMNANKIELVPLNFPNGQLHNTLSQLCLHDNLIREVSNNISELHSLKELHLERNQLSAIPVSLHRLSLSLLLLRVDGNPIQSKVLAEAIRSGVYETPDEKKFNTALRKIVDSVTGTMKDFNARGAVLEVDKSWAAGSDPAKSRRSRFKEIFGKEVRKIYARFDTDSSSGLAPWEFKEMLLTLVPSMTLGEAESMVAVAFKRGGIDADGDGEISVDEFLTVVEQSNSEQTRANPTEALLKWCEYQHQRLADRSSDVLITTMSRNQKLQKELDAMERQKTQQQQHLQQERHQLNLAINNVSKYEKKTGATSNAPSQQRPAAATRSSSKTVVKRPGEVVSEAARIEAKRNKNVELMVRKRELQAELDLQKSKLKTMKRNVSAVQGGSLLSVDPAMMELAGQRPQDDGWEKSDGDGKRANGRSRGGRVENKVAVSLPFFPH